MSRRKKLTGIISSVAPTLLPTLFALSWVALTIWVVKGKDAHYAFPLFGLITNLSAWVIKRDQIAKGFARAAPFLWPTVIALSWLGLAIIALKNTHIHLMLLALGITLNIAAWVYWQEELRDWIEHQGLPKLGLLVAMPFFVTLTFAWLNFWHLWQPGETFVSYTFLWRCFTHGLLVSLLVLFTFRWIQQYMGLGKLAFWVFASLAIIPVFLWLVINADYNEWKMEGSPNESSKPIGPYIGIVGVIVAFLTGLLWAVWWVDKKTRHFWNRTGDDYPKLEANETAASSKRISTILPLALLTAPLGLDRFYCRRPLLGILKIAWLLALMSWIVFTLITDAQRTGPGHPPDIGDWLAGLMSLEMSIGSKMQVALLETQSLIHQFYVVLSDAASATVFAPFSLTGPVSVMNEIGNELQTKTPANFAAFGLAAAILLSGIFWLCDLILLAIGKYHDADHLPVRMQPANAIITSSISFRKTCPLVIGLGWLGIDRFATGRWRLGLLKLAWLGVAITWGIIAWRTNPDAVSGWLQQMKIMAGFDLLFLGHLADQLFAAVLYAIRDIPALALDGDLGCQAVVVAGLIGICHWLTDIRQLFTGRYLDHKGHAIRQPKLDSDYSPAVFSKTATYGTFFGFIGLDRFYIGRWQLGLLRLALFSIIPLAIWGAHRSNPYYLQDKLPPNQIRLLALKQASNTNWLKALADNFTVSRAIEQTAAKLAKNNRSFINSSTNRLHDPPSINKDELSRLIIKGLLTRFKSPWTPNFKKALKYDWMFDPVIDMPELESTQSLISSFLANTNNFGTDTNMLKIWDGMNEIHERAKVQLKLLNASHRLPEISFYEILMNPGLPLLNPGSMNDEAWAMPWKNNPPTPRGNPIQYRLAKTSQTERQELGQLFHADALVHMLVLDISERTSLGMRGKKEENKPPFIYKEENPAQLLMNRDKDNDGRVNEAEAGLLYKSYAGLDANNDGFIEQSEIDAIEIPYIRVPRLWRDPESLDMFRALAIAGFKNGGWRSIVRDELPGLGSAIIRDALKRKDHWGQLMLFGLLSTALWIAIDLALLCMGRLRDSRGLQVRLKPIQIHPTPLESMNQAVARPDHQTWNPLNLNSWYYGRAKQKLKQSFNTCISYTLMFFLMIFLLSFLGCQKMLYELPAGGGEPELKQIVKQVIKIKEVPIVNPLSNLIRPVPPIEEILKDLLEETMHRYETGQGKGKGAGFAGGTRRGKVRFIRLRYAGGDWDQDLDLNSDLNMLLWYSTNTGQPTAKLPETKSIGQLRSFPKGKSPPLVYMTGERSISISQSEVETLREFLIDKHGMIFADNGGSSGWHSQFFSLMRRVLPKVTPRAIPIDHPVHSGLSAIPIVAPHGGQTAYGWVVESRIVAYYHPGDVGDAWADGHAGVPRRIWEASYRLGGNIILYAHSEYSKWLQTQQKKD